MAEVPEVETLVRDLQQAVVGRRLTGAEVLDPAAVRFPSHRELSSLLEGRRVTAARRRAKLMLLSLDDGQVLALHLMLWGNLSLRPVSGTRPEATLVVFGLEGGEELIFSDTLGYARAALAPADELAERLKLSELGPEALADDFTPELLARQLRRRRGPLKTVLLNQRVLAGLGNRDADESLWSAGLHPRRSASSLTPPEVGRLHEAIREVLDEGIRLRGTQRDLFGIQGQARHHRHVFGRTGEPCPRCGMPVHASKLGGRNTHWCPHCQPEHLPGHAPPLPLGP
ncbi:bifunctional DNA-formamidopyrimidine glycosylase/DNA-(apurinic or apyrimidinic site) lyase [Cystobacter ferrugineus]|uniref:Formamidopyrimidine-DNA glycosylase n=1 Tax=Cystobacter ferrugineus TaxID=83449 RepID=A0A1L9BAH1_9BACT|nr:bifunctional DNA-formamidopyrimidine glycosylase/DNA-(apurinic or apyrimidinic site) lyase [Cystobacter ferrugineus]OJH39254.1 DNA-formamidopyrimidine glycosylase [Cystobacter ferrugineus]